MFDYMDVSPKMVFSVATALIPFLQNDDPTRALMGSNMQRQAVPLLTTEAPVVGTGMEPKTAVDSGVCVVATAPGVVESAESNRIIIREEDGKLHEYALTKFSRSNQSNCYNQRPIVFKGDHVEAGEVIADGPSTSNGELALGKNPLIGFMTWEGYNYEDAVLLSERLVQDDVYTSVHIEEYEVEARDTKLGPEEITREVPQVGEDAVKDLDFDLVLGLESRGFIFGTPIAYNLKKGFIPVRKKGKLPRETVSISYNLEYGSATIEMHKDSIKPGMRVVIVDDLAATGGTIEAAAKLVEKLGGEVAKIVFLIELPALGGRKRLSKYDVDTVVAFDGE
jgi:adenine phosphoribosyltransferase